MRYIHIKQTLLISLLASSVVLAGCAIEPESISKAARQARIKADLVDLYKNQEPVSGPVSLSEAIARALKYNLDQRVKLMEQGVAFDTLDVAQYDLLPTLALNAGYFSRDNDPGASSQSLLSGLTSLEPSTSQERTHRTVNANLVWNVLDFGVSYANAKQRADEVNIAGEMRRKVIQNIVQDVQTAWWRAVVADRLSGRIEQVLKDARQAINRTRELETKRLKKPLEALQRQRSLLELIDRMTQLRKEMSQAKLDLAKLMNLKPGTEYRIAIPTQEKSPALNASLTDLEQTALSSRPELREEDYRKRISSLEVRKALLRMFPGLEINFGHTYDSNKFLFNNNWSEVGLQVTWNIFNVFSGPAAQRQAQSQVKLADTRRLAMSAAVLAQVNVAWQKYQESIEDFSLARELSDVEDRIVKNVAAAKQANRVDASDVVMSRASSLNSELRRGLAYAELQSSVARIHNTLGTDPLPDVVGGRDIKTLSTAIAHHLTKITADMSR